jgi:hypothetical protein
VAVEKDSRTTQPKSEPVKKAPEAKHDEDKISKAQDLFQAK